jgi:hypothetical protein
MCAAPASSNEFMLQLHRVHLRDLVGSPTVVLEVIGNTVLA